VPSKGVTKVLGGLGINILSTSHGVMTGKQARKSKVGGEVLCVIY
jgi:small subunit ribosomal protein S8